MEKNYLRPLHVGISVKDMDESISWYKKHLHFKTVSRKYMLPLQSVVTFMRHGDFEIELFRHDSTIALPEGRLQPNKDIQTQGTKHICFAHEDVAGLLKRLKAEGVEIVMGPQIMEGTVMGFIHDPNGVLIEFVQPIAS